MRMWMVDPEILCRQHLLGEHSEIHKFRHCFEREYNMATRIERGQIDPERMAERHDALAAEMLRRGYNHQSPYKQPPLDYLADGLAEYDGVDVEAARADLIERCVRCAERFYTRKRNYTEE